jgi:tRNA(fMet)-specific endonuclease VapC
MSYLLDTNVCIALINGRPERVRTQFAVAVDAAHTLAVPSVVAHELWYGAAKSTRPERNAERLEIFFAGPVEVWSFTEDDSRAAGRVRAALETDGQPIGAYDALIAGQAIAREATLVTANLKEFARIDGLACADWTA